MLNKSVFGLVALVVVALAIAATMSRSDRSFEIPNEAEVEPVTERATDPSQMQSSVSNPNDTINSIGEMDEVAFSQEEIAEMNSWLSDHGFDMLFTEQGKRNAYNHQSPVLTSYDIYDLDTLEALAESDEHARLALGLRLYEENDWEAAQEVLRQSAIDGFGAPLNKLFNLLARVGKDQIKAKNPEAETTLVDAYAWQHVYNLRFFPNSLVLEGTWSLRMDDAELERIKLLARERGAEIYSELERERSARGLPPFDNNVPVAMTRIAERRNG